MLEIRSKCSLSLSPSFSIRRDKKQILKQNASKLSVPVRAIEAEEDIVDNEIIALRKELRKAQVLKTVLASECKRATKRSGDAKRCMEAVKNLKSTLDGEGEDNLSLDKLFSELSTDVGALRQLETRMNGMDSLFIIRLLSAQTDLNTHTQTHRPTIENCQEQYFKNSSKSYSQGQGIEEKYLTQNFGEKDKYHGSHVECG